MRRLSSCLIVAATVLAMTPAALAQHAQPAAPAGSKTVQMQGGNPRDFLDNPYMRSFYKLSVDVLKPGAPPLDFAAYQTQSLALFNAFGESMAKGGGKGMEDHLKLIPGQVVQIVKADPHVLDDYEAFTDAMVGPK